MKFIKKTNILVETKRRFIIRHGLTNDAVQCPHCVEQMIFAGAAADLFKVSSRAIYRLIEAGTIHFAETENNQMYVCPTSIGQIFQTGERPAPRLLDRKQ